MIYLGLLILSIKLYSGEGHEDEPPDFWCNNGGEIKGNACINANFTAATHSSDASCSNHGIVNIDGTGCMPSTAILHTVPHGTAAI